MTRENEEERRKPLFLLNQMSCTLYFPVRWTCICLCTYNITMFSNIRDAADH